jgi:TP901 family phage tail tape measure protein
MANQMVASLLLKLEDQLSGGLDKLTSQLDRMRDVASKLQLSGLKDADQLVEALNKRIGASASELYRMQQRVREIGPAFAAMERIAKASLTGVWEATAATRAKIGEFGNKLGVVGGVAGAYSLAKPIEDYAAYDQQLRAIAITEHKTGPQLAGEIARLRDKFNADALATGQSSESIAAAYHELIGSGLSSKIIDEAIGIHSRAATAYGIRPDQMGQLVGAALQNLKIPASELGGFLAAAAQATQSGNFKITDLNQEFPGISGIMANLGVTGRGGADQAFAALEIIRRSSSQSGQAAANYFDALNHLTAPRDQSNFKKVGFNLDAILLGAEKRHQNPLEAVLDAVQKLVSGKGPVSGAIATGALFRNQQDLSAMLALLQHRAEFEGLRKTLDGISQLKLDTDFAAAFAAPQMQINNMDNATEILTQALGQAFMPILTAVTRALIWLVTQLEWANKNFPVTTQWVLGLVGGFLALAAVAGTLSFVLPAVAAGFELIGMALNALVLAPLRMLATSLRFLVFLLASLTGISVGALTAIGALAAVLVGAAVDIYEHWNRFAGFFQEIWDGMKAMFQGFINFLQDVFALDFARALDDIEAWGHGFAKVWDGIFGVVKQLFMDFGAWVDSWSDGLGTRIAVGIVNGLKGSLHAFTPTVGLHDLDTRVAGWLGLDGGTAAARAGSPLTARAHGHVHIHVTTDGNVRVTRATGSPGTNVINRGQTVNRP